MPESKGSVKGSVLQSRLELVKEEKGAAGRERILEALGPEDREALSKLLSSRWYPFDLHERLDAAIASQFGEGEALFLRMGEKSALQNLGSVHRVFVAESNPHGLLKHATTIYRLYYDTGHRTYEKAGEKKAILRTFESATYSKEDCLTVIGWHRKAIAMCGGRNVRISETKCRARGDEICEYVCEWD
ncbi:MAG TPA: TIGR02265 family protein [Thermoanaerobaculia bacterium]|nr:TIGR02265 family protein [Thermoanaerobaculia bacterium]